MRLHCYGFTLFVLTQLTLACGGFGCSNANVSQRLWHEQMAWISNCVMDGSARDITFAPSQLRIMAGEPDCVLTVRQFLGRAREDSTALRHQLTNSITKGATQVRPSEDASVWTNSNTGIVDDCVLWVYEESRRFPRPLPSGTGLSDHYYCYVFIIRDSVLGVTQFGRWKGLRD